MPKKNYHHGELRQALLDAAHAEIAAHGVDSFSLRNCAKRAGVSHAAPAHHFKDSASLLRRLAKQNFTQLAQTMDDCLSAPDMTTKQQLINMCIAYVDFASTHHKLFALMFKEPVFANTEENNEENNTPQTNPVFSIFVKALARLRGQDALQNEQIWRDVAAIWSMIHGHAELMRTGQLGYISQLSTERRKTLIADMINHVIDVDKKTGDPIKIARVRGPSWEETKAREVHR